jgi:hypothetical protein
MMEEADEFMRGRINDEIISEIVSLVPEGWLNENEPKLVYANFLMNRLAHAYIFVKGINDARQAHI